MEQHIFSFLLSVFKEFNLRQRRYIGNNDRDKTRNYVSLYQLTSDLWGVVLIHEQKGWVSPSVMRASFSGQNPHKFLMLGGSFSPGCSFQRIDLQRFDGTGGALLSTGIIKLVNLKSFVPNFESGKDTKKHLPILGGN